MAANPASHQCGLLEIEPVAASFTSASLELAPVVDLRHRLVDGLRSCPAEHGLSKAEAVESAALQRFVCGLRSCPALHATRAEELEVSDLHLLVCVLRDWPSLHGARLELAVAIARQRFVCGFLSCPSLHTDKFEVVSEAELCCCRMFAVSIPAMKWLKMTYYKAL
jgi:hypothetical protein